MGATISSEWIVMDEMKFKALDSYQIGVGLVANQGFIGAPEVIGHSGEACWYLILIMEPEAGARHWNDVEE